MRSRKALVTPIIIFALILALVPTYADSASLSTPAPSLAAQAQDASTAYQLNPQHSGSIQGSTLKPPLKQLWSQHMGGDMSYPLVVSDTIYVVAGSKLSALRLRTGGTIWGPVELGSEAYLAYDNGRVFSASTKGLVQAFDAQAGTQAWQVQLPSASPPTAYNGIIYVQRLKELYAFQETDGKVLWKVRTNFIDQGILAVDDSGVYLTSGCLETYAFGPSSGNILWHYNAENNGYCGGGETPALYRDRLYVRSLARVSTVLDTASGKSVSAFPVSLGSPPRDRIPVFYGRLGFFSTGGTPLAAVDLPTNSVAWQLTGSYGQAIVINGTIYVGTYDDIADVAQLEALDAATGKTLYQTILPAKVRDGRPDGIGGGLAAGSGALVVEASDNLLVYSNDVPNEQPLYFPETKHSLDSPFREYWEQNGDLAIFGYPITDAYRERNAQDGKEYLVQYFERNRFEYHPENANDANVILLGLLGSEQTAARRATGEAPFNPVPAPGRASDGSGLRYFPQTGHTMDVGTSAYWKAHGGLAIFGYPISEPFMEKSADDGKTYLVQYFERNRFEVHPRNLPPNTMLLGRLGVVALQNRSGQP
jgi:outer membrane protein assembly factor BamB